MAEELREQVAEAAADIANHAALIRQRGPLLHAQDPNLSVQLDALGVGLTDYASVLYQMVLTPDDAALDRAARGPASIFQAHQLVLQLIASMEQGATVATYAIVASLAALPGDPTIGLPPPIKPAKPMQSN